MTRSGTILATRFRLERRIGEGGMGTVYEAVDQARDERVALKVLKQRNAGSLGRFKREFRSLADLNHPNLVTLGELVSEGEDWFFTMELVRGEDFVSWASGAAEPPLRFEERRLRAALGQLAQALSALHETQKVHRDVKPSNVLVEASGRVVLLDFGLVRDTSEAASQVTDLDVVGTPAYMAPEQAASRPVGPAADWYAVGAMLYEILTGEVPFSGAPLEVLLEKQRREPTPPAELVPDLPPDLASLCAQLLRFDPGQRPTGRQVLRALDQLAAPEDRASLPTTVSLGVPFIGRDAELAALRRAYEASREGRAVTLLVRGDSGIGKTCMVRNFTETLMAQERGVLVLHGRCHERESLPYKAVDGAVDALASFLARLPPKTVERYLPTRATRLLQLFPVLRRVEAIAKAPGADDGVLDPHEARVRAFGAMRELLARLGEAHPLVLVIDDLQWADGDSYALLAELLRPPDEPAMLLVATVRTTPGAASPPSPDPATLLPGDVSALDVHRLPLQDARLLVTKLVERIAPDLPISADTLAEEADGHPLFIDEIVRHLFLVGASQGELRLEDVLWSRIAMLEDVPRRIVELLAVASAPLPQAVVARAAEAGGPELARLLSFLRVAHLVRATGARGSDMLEVFHGRVREAVLANLSEEACTRLHLRIALALEATGSAETYLLAVHWLGAGDREKAAKHMLTTADRVAETLAFERAASLYERALELREGMTRRTTLDETRALYTKLGDALVNAGRGARAARAYRAAAATANAADALDLRRRAADQLLRSGHFDEGMTAIQEVLGAIGMTIPPSPLRALLALLLWRAVVALRGHAYRLRDASHASARELTRIDVCCAAALSLSLVDPINGQLFQARNILWSLACGEPRRVSRALALEVGYAATAGFPAWKRVASLDTQSRELARSIGEPYCVGWSLATSGTAHYLGGFFEKALERCDEAERVLVNDCVGANWEVASARLFALQALSQMGRLRELALRQPGALRAATEHGDLYSAVGLRTGHPNLAWLLAGDPKRARHEVAEAMREWSKRGFHIEHYFELLALTNADLYEDEPHAALARFDACAPAIRRSFITRVQAVRISLLQLRARAAMGVASKDPARRSDALTVVRRMARSLSREDAPWARALPTLLEASVAHVTGDSPSAVTLLERAVHEADQGKLGLVAAAARHARGVLVGGDEGKRLAADGLAWAANEGAKAPDRLFAMAAPGFERR
jgi:tetratricopeptide (TPR) repeat protein